MNSIIQFLLDNELIILAFICGCILGIWIGMLQREDEEDENNDN